MGQKVNPISNRLGKKMKKYQKQPFRNYQRMGF